MSSVSTDRRLGLVGSVAFKPPCDCATTSNIALSGEQTVDGFLTSSSRVLVKNQTDQTANGIYDTNSGPWTRSIDSNGNYDFKLGTTVLVTGGNQSGQYWQVMTANPITIGTSNLTFALALTSSSSTLSFLQSGSGAVARSVQSKLRDYAVNILDFGAFCDGTNDDAPATNLAIAYLKTLSVPAGTILFPALTRWNSGIAITNTHGVRFLGTGLAYAAGYSGSVSQINFYGAGNALTLTGDTATQSGFSFENLALTNVGNPGIGNGIVASGLGTFGTGLRVIGSVITEFSTGVNCDAGLASPYGYLYLRYSAIYSNATWGVSFLGNDFGANDCVITNNGPAWNTSTSGASVSVATSAGFIVTITANGHGLNMNQAVTLAGFLPAAYNGTFPITVTGTNTFTYTALSAPGVNTQLGTYSFYSSTLNASPVGGNLFIDGVTTSWAVNNCDFTGAQVAIFARGYSASQQSYGGSVRGCYFEFVTKAALMGINLAGIDWTGNYGSTNYEARTLMFDNCSGVRVGSNGYTPNVYVIGLSDYDIDGNLHYLDTTYNRTIANTMFAMRNAYGTKHVDINDTFCQYLSATPASQTGITGPSLQSEIGPFGAPVNQFVTTLGAGSAFMYMAAVAGTLNQYIYFSILLRNVGALQVSVQDAGLTHTIVSEYMTTYNTDWSVLTVGGLVNNATDTWQLLLLPQLPQTFQVGGVVAYTSPTPIAKQIFSFQNSRRPPNRRMVIPYTNSMTPDLTLGNMFQITATTTAAFAINQPLGFGLTGPDGDNISFRIHNTSTGTLGAATWNAVYKIPSLTYPAATFNRSYDFSNEGSTLWFFKSQSAADVPN